MGITGGIGRKGEKMKRLLRLFSTRTLVEELKKREGVEMTTVEPHKDDLICVDGPAVVLVVID